ncbi:hypothetical protein GCM10009854_47400 [Saccharopolyspora halophila]|uniref:Transposase n=1 Tax=Saccharopolyspora halophila TaxID=405551 RepID=A0ABP5TUS6_9PSEU
MLSGREYCLELTAAQAAQCEGFGNVCRAVWNTALGPASPVPRARRVDELHGRMRRLKRRERDRWQDFCSRVAVELVDRDALVALEDLRTRSMTRWGERHHRRTRPEHRQKSGLNRAVLEKEWHELGLALHNIARCTGSERVTVPAARTSQTCAVCRHVDPESRSSQAVFRCTGCGRTAHADLNAARYALAAGRVVAACGVSGAGRSAKQEPPPASAPLEPPALAMGRTSTSGGVAWTWRA